MEENLRLKTQLDLAQLQALSANKEDHTKNLIRLEFANILLVIASVILTGVAAFQMCSQTKLMDSQTKILAHQNTLIKSQTTLMNKQTALLDTQNLLFNTQNELLGLQNINQLHQNEFFEN